MAQLWGDDCGRLPTTWDKHRDAISNILREPFSYIIFILLGIGIFCLYMVLFIND